MLLRPPPLALRALAAWKEGQALREEQDLPRTQLATLARIRRRFGGTVLGQRQGLQSIRDLAELQQAPAHVAEDFLDLVEEVWAKNPPGLVSPHPVRYLMKTTGTSGQLKRMPYPDEAAQAHGALELAIATAYVAETGDAQVMGGHFLITAGTSVLERGPSGVALGYPTGISTDMAPWWTGDLALPTKDIRANADYHSRLEATLRQAYPKDVRVMTGVPAWVPPQLERLLEMAKAQERELAHVGELWPELRVYVWAGSPIGPYEALLRRLFGPKVRFREAYSAGEAPIAYQARQDDLGLRPLWSRCVFLLQDPSEGLDGPKLLPWEVELDRPYRLLVTTPGGVVNYHLGDLVVITQRHPLRLRFLRREVESLHLGAERAGLDQVQEAWGAACAGVGLPARPFVAEEVGPQGQARPHYRFHAELPPEALHALAEALEAALAERNPLIPGMRQAGLLGPLELVALAPGRLLEHLSRTKLFGQGKPTLLIRDPAEGLALREGALGQHRGPG